jgi:hypothetical protein
MELATQVMYMFQNTDATFENSTLRTQDNTMQANARRDEWAVISHEGW